MDLWTNGTYFNWQNIRAGDALIIPYYVISQNDDRYILTIKQVDWVLANQTAVSYCNLCNEIYLDFVAKAV